MLFYCLRPERAIVGKPVRKLVGLEVTETSGVDRAAHLHDGFLVMKSAEEEKNTQNLVLEALGLRKSEEDTMSEVVSNNELEKGEGYSEDESTMSMEEELKSYKKKYAELEKKMMGMMPKEKMKKSYDNLPEEIAKSLDGMPEEQAEVFAKAFIAQQEELAKAKETATQERDERLDAEAISKSRSTFTALGVDHDSVAPALRRIAALDEELAKSIEVALSSADAQLAEAGLLKEFGTAKAASGASVYEEAKTLAKSLVENGVVKTIEQGIEKVLDSNPELAKRYYKESN